MNIPHGIKGRLPIKENARQGFIWKTNDSEKNRTKNFLRRILSKSKSSLDKIYLDENLKILKPIIKIRICILI